MMTELDCFLSAIAIRLLLITTIGWCVWYAAGSHWIGLRVRLWRTIAAMILVMIGLSMAPPLLTWSVAPRVELSSNSSYKEKAIDVVSRPSSPPQSNREVEKSRSPQTQANVEPDSPQAIAESDVIPATIDRSSLAGDWTESSERPAGRAISSAVPSVELWWIGFVIWLVVAAGILLRMVVSLIYLARMRRTAVRAETSTQQLTDRICRDFGIHPVECLCHTSIDSPMVFGVLRPVIMLPSRWDDQSSSLLTSLLAHELSHIKSRDLAWDLTLQMIRALLWFCPTLWRVPQAHRFACEVQADASAAVYVASRTAYRRCLAEAILLSRGISVTNGLSMASEPRIVQRLGILDSKKTFDSTTWDIVSLCALGLLAITISLIGPVQTEGTLAQDSTSQLPSLKFTKAKWQVIAEPVLPADQQPHESVMLKEPDGSTARTVHLYEGKRRVALGEEVLAKAVIDSKPIELDRGRLKLDLSNPEAWYWVRSGLGSQIVTVEQLRAASEIRLRSWSKLKVRVERGGKLASGVPVDVFSSSTSDGMYKISGIRHTAITDDKGVAEFAEMPLGTVNIKLDLKITIDKDRPSIRGTRSSSFQNAWLEEGETKEITFGRWGRPVRGKLDLPRDISSRDLKYVSASLQRLDLAGLNISLDVQPDGTFRCADVPTGVANVYVTWIASSPAQNFVVHQHIKIPAVGPDSDEEYDLGVLKVNKELPMVPGVTEQPRPELFWTEDSPRAPGPLAWIGWARGGTKSQVLFMNRKFEVMASPYARTLPHDRVFCDTKHKRWYVVRKGESQRTMRTELIAFDFQGDVVWKQEVAGGTPADLSIDESSGNAWLLLFPQVDEARRSPPPNLFVFDLSGKRLASQQTDSVEIRYQPVDSTFWLFSRKHVFKMDAASIRETMRRENPMSETYRGEMLPLSDGGATTIERVADGTWKSRNRLVRFNQTGEIVRQLDLGSTQVSSLVERDGSLYAAGLLPRGQYTDTPGIRSLLRVPLDFSKVEATPLDIDTLTLLSNSEKGILCLKNGQPSRLLFDEQGDYQFVTDSSPYEFYNLYPVDGE